ASASEAFDLGHGHALDPDLGQGILDLVQLERLDDGLDLLHGFLLRLTLPPRGDVAWPTPGPWIPSQGGRFLLSPKSGAVEFFRAEPTPEPRALTLEVSVTSTPQGRTI